MSGKLERQRRGDVHAGVAGHVVDHHGDRGGVGEHRVELLQRGLVHILFIVVRGDDQRHIRARGRTLFRQFDGLLQRLAPRSGDDLLVGGEVFSSRLHQLHLFVVREQRKLAVAPQNHKPRKLRRAERAHVLRENVVVHLSRSVERRSDGGENSANRIHTRSLL